MKTRVMNINLKTHYFHINVLRKNKLTMLSQVNKLEISVFLIVSIHLNSSALKNQKNYFLHFYEKFAYFIYCFKNNIAIREKTLITKEQGWKYKKLLINCVVSQYIRWTNQSILGSELDLQPTEENQVFQKLMYMC